MHPGRFVGRREQLARIDGALRRAEAGEPGVVVVGGEGGVGKTRLLEQVAGRLAGSGVRVLRGACVELGTEGLPLAPLTAMLRDLARDLGGDGLTTLLPGAHALWRLLPELPTPANDPAQPIGPAAPTDGADWPNGPGGPPGGPNAPDGSGAPDGAEAPDGADGWGVGIDQGRLFEPFAALLERLGAQRPVLLVIDDLQWADRSTRDLVGFLARTLRATRVLMIMAFRSDALGDRHPLRAFLAELGRLPNVLREDLPAFDRAETTELVAAVLGARPHAALADRVFRGSGGNALYAEELVRAGGDALPETLRDLLLQRFAGLPRPARGLVRLAAAGGPRISHELLAEVAGLPEADLLAALRAARDAQVLVPDGDGYAFRQGPLREAVAADLLPAERLRAHRTYAEALEARPGLVPPDRFAAEVAFHWWEAGDAARALPALLRAAEAAGAMNAHAEQGRMLVRALEIWPRAGRPLDERYDVLQQALSAAGWAGEDLQMIDLCDHALVEETDPGRTAILLAHRGMALHNLGRDGALTALDEALRTVARAGRLDRARVLDLVGAAFMLHDRPARAYETAVEARRLAEQLGEAVIAANAATTAGTVLAGLGRTGEALSTLTEVGEMVARRGDVVQLARVHLNRADLLGRLGRHEEAIEAARLGLEAARTGGLARTLGALLGERLAASLTATGRWDEAERAAVEALRLDPSSRFGSMLHAMCGDIAFARGDVEIAREELRLARTLEGAPQEMLPAALLEIRLAIGDNRLEEARASIARLLPGTGDTEIWPLLVLGARVEARLRDRERDRERQDERDGKAGGGSAGLRAALERRASALPVASPLDKAYAAAFRAETGEGPWADAVAAWDALGSPYRAAYSRLRAAEAAAGAGDRNAAAELLRTAADRAASLGARPLREEIEVVARASRVDLTTGPDGAYDEAARRAGAGREGVPGRARDGLGLTERETDVLRLVTAGRSNRQIAEELFISPKTASVHVSRILTKLDVATRGEAAALAHRLRLFPSDGAPGGPQDGFRS
ncbi:helix-turn-helix transcriptional regulator [Actinomadura sp. J1-007]|uniref:helix-turn-helix transcriptional regulator n=1 Tax=Actinomadura sp. J1-007 TaxID=2661913 RepID=UPI00136F389D|nr:helix-turn-helix transcriptional regulator [Actinomadura sp. J1-007]